MQKAAAIWTLKTQEVCKLPQSTTAKIMEDVGSLYESALVNIHAHVSSLLNESGISPETIPHLSAIFSPDGVHGSLFRGLETHARQLLYYKSHLQFVVSDHQSELIEHKLCVLFLSSIGAPTNCSGNAYGTKGERCEAKTGRSEGHNGVCADSSNSAGAVTQSCD